MRAAGPAPQAPVFTSRVQLVDVDVLVTDARGNVITDLAPEEVTILEDGRPQRIQGFRFVNLADQAAGETTPSVDVSSNKAAGRMFVLALNYGAPPRLARIAKQFIQDVIGPRDQAAVVTGLQYRPITRHGFTANRERLVAFLDGWRPPAKAEALMDNATPSFRAIEAISNELGRASNRRKVIVWFDPPRVFHPDQTPTGTDKALAQRDALRAAARNNVALYVVSSTGPNPNTGRSVLEGDAAQRLLAEETGGEALVSTNNFADGFKRFARDFQAYYLLAYEPETVYRDGKYHTLTVKVSRPGVRVRARGGYYAPDPDAPGAAALPASSVAAPLTLPLSGGDLGLDAFAVPFKAEGGEASVLIGLEVRGTDLVSPGTLDVASQLFKPAREEGPARRMTLDLQFTDASRTELLRSGIRLLDRLRAPAGTHQVRIAARQPGGKTGEVVVDVDVPDYGTPLVLSGVLLAATPDDGARSLLTDARLRGILGGDPTTRRAFTSGHVLSAFVEAYADGRAGDVQLSATLAPATRGTRRGEAIPVVPVPDGPGRTGYVTRVPLQDVQPGAYALTFAAKGKTGTVSRTVSFTVVK